MEKLAEIPQNRLVIGIKQTKRAIRNGSAERVFIASDCDSELSSVLLFLSQRKKIAVQTAPQMRDFGAILGIEVAAACAAIIKP